MLYCFMSLCPFVFTSVVLVLFPLLFFFVSFIYLIIKYVGYILISLFTIYYLFSPVGVAVTTEFPLWA